MLSRPFFLFSFTPNHHNTIRHYFQPQHHSALFSIFPFKPIHTLITSTPLGTMFNLPSSPSSSLLQVRAIRRHPHSVDYQLLCQPDRELPITKLQGSTSSPPGGEMPWGPREASPAARVSGMSRTRIQPLVGDYLWLKVVPYQ